MAQNLVIKTEGLEKLQKKLDGRILAQPLRNAFNRATLLLQREVQVGTPVDTGRLRASMTTRVDARTIPLWGKVGTDVKYAPFVEKGTRPHWPPLAAMQPWARRHGFPPGIQGAFLVAQAIARRGTRARRMFANAWEKSVGPVRGIFAKVAKEIEDEWRR